MILPPNEKYHYFNLGIARAELGDHQGALENFNLAINIDPYFADAYCNRGIARRELGDHQGAIEDYTQAINLDPKKALFYHCRGFSRLKLGNHQGAVEDYTQAIKLDSKNATRFKSGLEKKQALGHAYEMRGIARGEMGDHQGALEDRKRVMKLIRSMKSEFLGRENVSHHTKKSFWRLFLLILTLFLLTFVILDYVKTKREAPQIKRESVQ